jgi:REP element-mobilizing transposase RayT
LDSKRNDVFFRVNHNSFLERVYDFFTNLNFRIDEKEYQRDHTVGEASFSRKRKLNFKQLVVFLMTLLSKSIQKELNHYYRLMQSGEFELTQISNSAFTQARAKLKHTAFVELSDRVVDEFYNEAPWMSWLGRRVLCIDGSTICLPYHPDLKEVYGTQKLGSGDREKLMARISHLYDPLNKVIVHGTIAEYKKSEMSLCEGHLDSIQSGDVILCDRYYASVWLFLVLEKIGADFVMRLKEKQWTAAKELIQDGARERIVEFQADPDHLHLLKKYGVTNRKIKCRLVLVKLESGEDMVLCTSMTNEKVYRADDIAKVYAKRWGIEESYKSLKCRLDLANFSGRTPHAILQDFHVKIFLSNLCSLVTLEQELKLEKDHEKGGKKLKYRINRTFALSSFKDLPIFIFLKRKLKKALDVFYNLIKKRVSPVRDDRSFPRRTSIKKLSPTNYKPL